MKIKRILGIGALLTLFVWIIWFTKVYQTNPQLKVYSDAELKTFWGEHLSDLVVNQICGGYYPISEINHRYINLSQMIKNRYHHDLEVRMITSYVAQNEWISQGNQVENGVPIVELIIPTLINIHTELVSVYGPVQGEEFFKQCVVIGLMHELDHLAHGYSGTIGDKLDLLVENERQAWALTCEYTIRSLVEKSKVVLGPSEAIYYRNWIIAGRNVDSPIWIAFIRQAYAQTRK